MSWQKFIREFLKKILKSSIFFSLEILYIHTCPNIHFPIWFFIFLSFYFMFWSLIHMFLVFGSWQYVIMCPWHIFVPSTPLGLRPLCSRSRKIVSEFLLNRKCSTSYRACHFSWCVKASFPLLSEPRQSLISQKCPKGLWCER